ncbi:MAG: regulator [Methylomonas sp.]|nr:regulator [Methylomonas sp.]
MTTTLFDDSHIDWQTLTGFEHLHYFVLDIDTNAGTVIVLFKFAAGKQIILHRHKVPNDTFVIQGEHRIYEADGELREIRKVGSYTRSPASEVPHREGGGEIDAIVLFCIHGSDGWFYEILDDDFNIIAGLGMPDFIALHKDQLQMKTAESSGKESTR